MEIGYAELGDAAAILALQRAAYQAEAKFYDDPHLPPLRQTLAELIAEFDTHVFLKAVADGTIVGSVRALCADGICQIGRLMVAPDRQGQGIGTALMARIEAEFPQVHQFRLFTGARSDDNIRLYSRLGYRIVSTEVLNERVSVVVMVKSRRNGPPESLKVPDAEPVTSEYVNQQRDEGV